MTKNTGLSLFKQVIKEKKRLKKTNPRQWLINEIEDGMLEPDGNLKQQWFGPAPLGIVHWGGRDGRFATEDLMKKHIKTL